MEELSTRNELYDKELKEAKADSESVLVNTVLAACDRTQDTFQNTW